MQHKDRLARASGSPRARRCWPRRRNSPMQRDALSAERARSALGQGRQELCVRRTGRQRDARRAVRRQQPAHRLSLHARPRLGAGLPELLVLADHFDGTTVASRPSRRDVGRVSRAPLAADRGLQEAHGLAVQWVSSYGNDFNFDYHVSFNPDEIGGRGRRLQLRRSRNFRAKKRRAPACSTRTTSGEVFHTYSAYARGLDI